MYGKETCRTVHENMPASSLRTCENYTINFSAGVMQLYAMVCQNVSGMSEWRAINNFIQK